LNDLIFSISRLNIGVARLKTVVD